MHVGRARLYPLVRYDLRDHVDGGKQRRPRRGPARFAAAAVLLLLGAAPLAACNHQGHGNTAGEPDAAPGVDGSTPCMQCSYEATSFGGDCETPADTCNDSKACTALATCLSSCDVNDTSCGERCAAASTAAAVDQYNAVANCLCATACAAICGASCVGATDAGLDQGQDSGPLPTPDSGSGEDAGSCNACETAATSAGGACASALQTCDSNVSCLSLLNCLGNCQSGDTSCVSSCESSNDGGVSDFNAVSTCVCKTACATPCGSSCG